ncbi:MAG: nuclear transport factor 2 family protein [Zoogloeaceae bacterium]|jgi:ketosteroid isomerase-like protein|nr:nuclear transport factor 2 family protein [Zoogloeaceae bacterium]
MSVPLLFATPEDAEIAFYEAVARSNLDALMAVWSEDEDVSCIHPTGQHMQGLAAVREGWRQVLAPARMQIEANCMTRWQGMLMAVHQLVEHLHLGRELAGPLLVTHMYIRGAHGWRLVCRHCSTAAEPGMPQQESLRRVLH